MKIKHVLHTCNCCKFFKNLFFLYLQKKQKKIKNKKKITNKKKLKIKKKKIKNKKN